MEKKNNYVQPQMILRKIFLERLMLEISGETDPEHSESKLNDLESSDVEDRMDSFSVWDD